MPKPPPSRPRSATPAPHGPALRREVWEELRAVARPDARFHLDFSDFIPDFDGSEDANARLWRHPASSAARHVFATPDNSLIGLRRHVLAAGLGLVVSSFNMARGFWYFAPGSVPQGQELFAAWPDGLEHFACPLDLPALAGLGRFDLVVTGASAVAASGVRFGRGHGWFDLEWLLLPNSASCMRPPPSPPWCTTCRCSTPRCSPAPTTCWWTSCARPPARWTCSAPSPARGASTGHVSTTTSWPRRP